MKGFNFLDVELENETSSRGNPGKTVLQWVFLHGLIINVKLDTRRRRKQCPFPLHWKSIAMMMIQL